MFLSEAPETEDIQSNSGELIAVSLCATFAIAGCLQPAPDNNVVRLLLGM